MKTAENYEAELKKKIKNLAYFERANKEAIALGFISAYAL